MFRYTARTAQGEVVIGVVRADSERTAVVDLRRRALLVTSVVRGVEHPRLAAIALRSRRAVMAFFRAFAVLVKAGVPIRRALLIGIQHCNDRELREALHGVIADIEHGSSLSAALTRRPHQFSALQAAMIGAGEAGGVLDEVLQRMAELLEREHVVRKRVQAALAYPFIVALGASGLTIFLILHVVPMFASMFAHFGVPLPAATRLLLEAAGFVTSPLRIALLAASFALAFALGVLVMKGRMVALDGLRLHMPILGRFLRYVIVARLARMLGILLRSGVAILHAIDVLIPLAGSRSYANGLADVADALRRGEGIHKALEHTSLLDPLTLALVGVGEESGALDAMLLAAANYLDIEIETRLTALAAFLEPALIAFLGILVGFIVFSVFLPLYALIGSIS